MPRLTATIVSSQLHYHTDATDVKAGTARATASQSITIAQKERER